MEIKIHGSLDETWRYSRLLVSLYGKHLSFDYFIHDNENALAYAHDRLEPSFIEIADNGECIGHAAFIPDERLPKGAAFFGFFECVKDYDVFERLWAALGSEARRLGVSLLLGPVNGSIWHQYRVIASSKGEPFFPSEPITMPYYYDYLKSKEPSKEVMYHSAFRKKYDAIIRFTEKSYKEAEASGTRITLVDRPGHQLAQVIFDAAKKIFCSNWGYVEIAAEDFALLYDSGKIEGYVGSIYVADTPAGFAGFAMNLRFGNTLVMKTIGVFPEMQGKGIGNALVHRIHRDAQEAGIDKIVYGLVNKENKVKYFPTDDIKVFREYSAFEFAV